MTRVRTALVIGGGIAGPAAAIALRKAGIEATVHEAHPGGADGAGVFLTLGSNGIDALRVLDAADPILSTGFATPAMVLRSGTGKRLGESVMTTREATGTTSRTMKRADLYAALHQQAVARGITVIRGKRLVAAEETPDGVRARFADGTEATADVLVGCDGVHSTVRRVIDPAAPEPTYVGLISNGGYARGVTVDSAPGDYEMIFGRKAFFGYAMSPDGEVWWFANVPRRPEPARGEVERVGTEEWRARLLELFAADAGPALPLIRATPAEEFAAMTPVHAIPHLPRWHSRRMVVIGDAAHAPSPSSGQGASLSVEDAVVLAKSLRDTDDPADAFARFEAVRRPRVEQIVKWAAKVNSGKAAGPVARVFRDAMLPVVLKLTANSKTIRDTYAHKLEWDAPAGAGLPSRG
ncbi:FAD-dependent oxidoreductase [Phytohabitans sp. LJ34]|uniref:FAD-dependent oxidoreductase n=1 Tax=Phytohabitans sp. LJ34 TaxID=3452217 RepID=UPI003F89DEE3